MDSRLAYWGTILANALFRLREYEEALSEAEAACRRDDRYSNSRVVLAMVLAHQGRIDRAKEAMDEAKRLFPGLKSEQVVGLIGSRGLRILRDASLVE